MLIKLYKTTSCWVSSRLMRRLSDPDRKMLRMKFVPKRYFDAIPICSLISTKCFVMDSG